MLIKKRTSVTDFNFHLVFVTKYRKEVFTEDTLRNSLKEILQTIAENKEVIISHIEVMPDHVHMMVSFPPKLAPSDVVKSLKGTSAREWFKKYPDTKQVLYGGHLWSPSFFMSTVGNVSKEVVADYIKNQMNKSLKRKR